MASIPQSASERGAGKNFTTKPHYWMPFWSAPDWNDDETMYADNGAPITKDPLNRVRPAMREEDEARKPTEYARRFGIFPDRSDGRSRASPTRSGFRDIHAPGGGSYSGQDVVNYFQQGTYGQNPALDQAMTREYEDLTMDEYWQGILFGDMTTDEV
ncbi:hypothetical protein HJFPF1_05439 [Paramyrothecium foliicola]|nr:hypothetical protein HJFPF1_05439 [Paramyrothecium foliicola]